jgi:hypothetical protein
MTNESTPAGTVKRWIPPVKINFTRHVAINEASGLGIPIGH